MMSQWEIGTSMIRAPATARRTNPEAMTMTSMITTSFSQNEYTRLTTT